MSDSKPPAQLSLPFDGTLVTCEGRKADVDSPSPENRLPLAWILGQKDCTLAQVERARKTESLDFLPQRVMARLQQAEAHEAEPFYQQHIRQAWIIVSLLQKGVSNPFVLSSYAIYGVHPDFVWHNIVADRKARLCDEYFTWYTSDDVLRPDVPPIKPPSSAALPPTRIAANGANSEYPTTHGLVGPIPTERKLV